MKEVTDALLIMVLVLKSVMSSLLYNVSTIIYFMMQAIWNGLWSHAAAKEVKPIK